MIRIVRFYSKRVNGEGPRLGTVRRPPRGVRKEDYAALNIYDVWFPVLSPSNELRVSFNDEGMTVERWRKKFRAEMRQPEPRHALDVLATLSHHVDFSIGCYCKYEDNCHRFVLRELLEERGARLAPKPKVKGEYD